MMSQFVAFAANDTPLIDSIDVEGGETMTNRDRFCCDKFQAQLNWACAEHSSPSDCPDALVGRIGGRGYGLYIHDGGSSLLEIHFCPWCGTRLANAPMACNEN